MMHIYTYHCIIIRMTKLARQQLIVELVHEGPLPNQQELVKVLARRGFPVTQATLSRDINELRLVRTLKATRCPMAMPALIPRLLFPAWCGSLWWKCGVRKTCW